MYPIARRSHFLAEGRPQRDNAAVSKTVAIIGAGPAGLTAGYLLAKAGVEVTVIETFVMVMPMVVQ